MRRFVKYEDVVGVEELPVEGSDERDRFVEVVMSGSACGRARLEDLVPDLVRALSGINSSIVTLSEQVAVLTGERDG